MQSALFARTNTQNVVDLLAEHATVELEPVSVSMDGREVLAPEGTEILEQVDTVLETLSNALSVLTNPLNVVDQLVVTVTEKLENVNVKMDGLEVLAAAATVV